MARVKRYYAVMAKRGRVVHRADHITEGFKTVCGIVMQLGWHWRRGEDFDTRRCPHCYGA